jgi:hypothetical protein
MKASELKKIIREEVANVLTESYQSEVETIIRSLAKKDRKGPKTSYLNWWFKTEDFKDYVSEYDFNRKTAKHAAASLYNTYFVLQ